MYTIEDLSNRKVALKNDGTLEELREVLNLAFPKDAYTASGDCKYYYAFGFNINKYNGTDEKLIIPTQSVKDFIKQIRDKEMKETNKAFVDPSINTYSDEKVKPHLDRLKQEMENKQEYELVDFKIEDLRGGETLVHEDSEFKIEGFVGNICFLTFKGVIVTYTKESLKNKEFKLKVPKPKVEKIQGFEVREYPELPLVEVSDFEDFPDEDTYITELINVENNVTPFETKSSVFMFCRPVPLERRNFIDIED